MPMKNSIIEKEMMGKNKPVSLFVRPGKINRTIWYIIKGLLIISPVYVEILMEEKKYSPGANCKNFTPLAGCCKIEDMSFT